MQRLTANANDTHSRDRSIDAVKGALICLVILGHIPTLQHQEPLIVTAFYTFHVASFLLLTFLYPPPPFAFSELRDRAVRYVAPFLLFYTLYAVAYGLMFRPDVAPPIALRDYVIGLLIASSRTLETASGLKMLWFLPALTTLTFARSFLARQPRSLILLILVIAGHVSVGDSGLWRYLMPWGLAVVLFIYPLGPGVAALVEATRGRKLLHRSILALCLSLHILVFMLPVGNLKVDLGDLQLYGISQPFFLVLQDMLIVTTSVSLIVYSHLLAKIPGLALCGRYSLPVYLVHPAITQLVIHAPHVKDWPWPQHVMLILVCTILSAGGAGLLAGKLPRLYHAIFPRRARDLALAR